MTSPMSATPRSTAISGKPAISRSFLARKASATSPRTSYRRILRFGFGGQAVGATIRFGDGAVWCEVTCPVEEKSKDYGGRQDSPADRGSPALFGAFRRVAARCGAGDRRPGRRVRRDHRV